MTPGEVALIIILPTIFVGIILAMILCKRCRSCCRSPPPPPPPPTTTTTAITKKRSTPREPILPVQEPPRRNRDRGVYAEGPRNTAEPGRRDGNGQVCTGVTGNSAGRERDGRRGDAWKWEVARRMEDDREREAERSRGGGGRGNHRSGRSGDDRNRGREHDRRHQDHRSSGNDGSQRGNTRRHAEPVANEQRPVQNPPREPSRTHKSRVQPSRCNSARNARNHNIASNDSARAEANEVAAQAAYDKAQVN